MNDKQFCSHRLLLHAKQQAHTLGEDYKIYLDSHGWYHVSKSPPLERFTEGWEEWKTEADA
jgi:hypothetical protein